MLLATVLVPVVTILYLGRIQDPPQDARVAEALAQSRQAANELGETVRNALQKELASGNLESAVRVCSQTAQSATRDYRERTGIDIRRVSLRLRNPVNAPDELERAVLTRFDRQRDEGQPVGETYQIVSAGGVETLRYLRPLVAASMCLSCHGPQETIPAPVKALLAERYPGDAATGHRTGDVRGAISVRVPLPARR
jgi:hypothetical protein